MYIYSCQHSPRVSPSLHKRTRESAFCPFVFCPLYLQPPLQFLQIISSATSSILHHIMKEWRLFKVHQLRFHFTSRIRVLPNGFYFTKFSEVWLGTFPNIVYLAQHKYKKKKKNLYIPYTYKGMNSINSNLWKASYRLILWDKKERTHDNTRLLVFFLYLRSF